MGDVSWSSDHSTAQATIECKTCTETEQVNASISKETIYHDFEFYDEYTASFKYQELTFTTKETRLTNTLITKSGSCGDNLTWTLDNYGRLIIRGSGDMYEYSAEDKVPWHSYRANIIYAIVEKGVTSIGPYAFSNCSSLLSVRLHEGISKIGKEAFYNDKKLLEIFLPEGLEILGNSCFKSCDSITNMVIPDTVIEMGDGSVSYCNNLEYIKLPNGITEVPSNFAFNCTKLKEVVIPDTVRTIWGSFCGCSSLETISLPENLRNIYSGTFTNCSKLVNITLPKNLVNLSTAAFSGCSSLKSITIPEGITSLEQGMFNGCSSLEKVILPKRLRYIEKSAFEGCSSLKEIEIPSLVTNIGNRAFLGCSSLENVEFPLRLISIGEFAFEDCTSLGDIVITDNVRQIGSTAFSGCSNLKSIAFCSHSNEEKNIPDIGSGAFNGVTSNVYINQYNTAWTDDAKTNYGGTLTWSNYTNDTETIEVSEQENGYVINTCKYCGQQYITDEVKSDGVTAYGSMKDGFYWKLYADGHFVISGKGDMPEFENITDNSNGYAVTKRVVPWENYLEMIKTVSIESGITSLCEYAFYDCVNITSVNITNTLEYIGRFAFCNCKKMTNINLPDSIIKIDSKTFSNCSSLKTINLPSGLTSIPSTLFENCKSLEEVVIPEGVNSIGSFAFTSCVALKEIKLPDDLKSIDFESFSGCNSLSEIIVPDSVTSIGRGAFPKNESFVLKCNPESTARTYADNNNYVWNCITHGERVTNPAVEEACSHVGYTEGSHCKDCGYIFVAQQEIPALDHQYTETITKEASCTEDGNKQYVCGVCGDIKNEIINALKHDMHEVIVEATCTKSGYARQACSRCDYYYDTHYYDAKGHSWNEGEIITEATCTEYGTKKYTCKVCSETQEESITPPGHTLAEAVTENYSKATCQSTGCLNTVIYCSTCNQEIERRYVTIPKIDHDYKETIIPATCTEAGYTLHECRTCDESYRDAEVEVTGHTAVTDAAVAAICTATGLSEGSHCSVCKEVLVVQTVTEKTGHSYGDWKIIKDSKCSEKGFQIRSCQTCGFSDTQNVDEKGHEWEEEYTVDQAASCTENGSQSIHCKKCEAVKDGQEIVATGHSAVTDEAVPATCIATGLSEEVIAPNVKKY